MEEEIKGKRSVCVSQGRKEEKEGGRTYKTI